MENKIEFNDLLVKQVDLSNAIKGLKAFTDDRFTYLKNITIDDLDALNGLVACIEIISKQQFDNLVDYSEQEVTA